MSLLRGIALATISGGLISCPTESAEAGWPFKKQECMPCAVEPPKEKKQKMFSMDEPPRAAILDAIGARITNLRADLAPAPPPAAPAPPPVPAPPAPPLPPATPAVPPAPAACVPGVLGASDAARMQRLEEELQALRQQLQSLTKVTTAQVDGR